MMRKSKSSIRFENRVRREKPVLYGYSYDLHYKRWEKIAERVRDVFGKEAIGIRAGSPRWNNQHGIDAAEYPGGVEIALRSAERVQDVLHAAPELFQPGVTDRKSTL